MLILRSGHLGLNTYFVMARVMKHEVDHFAVKIGNEAADDPQNIDHGEAV